MSPSCSTVHHLSPDRVEEEGTLAVYNTPMHISLPVGVMASNVRRSRRLQEKAKTVLDSSLIAANFSNNSHDCNAAEKEIVDSTKKNATKRKREASNSENRIQDIIKKQVVKVKDGKENEKLKSWIGFEKTKRKSRHVEKSMNRLREKRDWTLRKKVKKDEKYDNLATSNLSNNSKSSSSSDDEWEDVNAFDFSDTDTRLPSGSIEITIKKSKVKVKPKETVGSRRARYIKQHVNQKLRERQINCHKMHLLCYIAHLRIWTRILLHKEQLLSMSLSVIPKELVSAACHDFDNTAAEEFLQWFRATYQPAKKVYRAKNNSSDAQVNRLEELIAGQVYENDKDLAFLLFLSLIALKQAARICLSCQPMPLKLKMQPSSLESVETLISYYGSRKLTADDYMEWPKKLDETVKQITFFDCKNQGGNDLVPAGELSLKRNYWVEFWDKNSHHWICLDPWTKSTNMPEAVEVDATSPIHYVLCIDNEYGMRDVTARYASKYLTPVIRRLWVNQEWWNETLKIYQSRNRVRERLEDIAIQKYLFSKPKPTTVAEYKNHPLYVLERDLSKYEALYPETQQPVGQIKEFNIYLRSSVQRLDGAINWMKQLRSIKPNEKPYRVVERRSSNRASAEYTKPKTVDLYGRWQTMPYVTPKVVNGHIPRNEFGNLYVYKKSMVPAGCVHLQLNGLISIARQLGIDCVPAVVGWNHCRGGTHPILDGCVVLKEHEEELRKAWSKQYEKKKINAAMKRTQRAIKNWRRLVKGLLTMEKVRARFASRDHRLLDIDEKLENDEKAQKNSTRATSDAEVLTWPSVECILPNASSKL
uniref:Rad4 beta-hairpin domain-containing protein n=1 Tax=Setaria digitata TaxID=48799 RepID=A0A915Q2V2_9BILA